MRNVAASISEEASKVSSTVEDINPDDIEVGDIGFWPVADLLRDPNCKHIIESLVANFCAKEYPVLITDKYKNFALGYLITIADKHGLSRKPPEIAARGVYVVRQGEPPDFDDSQFPPVEVVRRCGFKPYIGSHYDSAVKVRIYYNTKYRPTAFLTNESKTRMLKHEMRTFLEEKLEKTPELAGVVCKVMEERGFELGASEAPAPARRRRGRVCAYQFNFLKSS